MLPKKTILIGATVSLLLTTALWSAEENARTKASDFSALVKQLDAERFSSRQSAQQKLTEAGLAAITALTKGARSENRETSLRSLEILQEHFSSSDASLNAAAKIALEQIAKGGNAAAHRAQQSLVLPMQRKAIPQPEIQTFKGGGVQIKAAINGSVTMTGAMQIGGDGIVLGNGGYICIQRSEANGEKIKVSMENKNGVMVIEAEENGKKTSITEVPNKEVKISVTEIKNGKGVTQKYEAKNADDLKKNHPVGFKIYQKQKEYFGSLHGQKQSVRIQKKPARKRIIPVHPVDGKLLKKLRQGLPKQMKKKFDQLKHNNQKG